MIHEQCMTCSNCIWVAFIDGKWQCECMRPRFWGFENENGKECDNYQKESN